MLKRLRGSRKAHEQTPLIPGETEVTIHLLVVPFRDPQEGFCVLPLSVGTTDIPFCMEAVTADALSPAGTSACLPCPDP